MFAAALILFREVLEMALVISLVLAATRGAQNRIFYVLAGGATGVAGACLVALFADRLSNALAGAGADAFNAFVLLLASATIGWTVVWMKKHGRNLSLHIKELGKKVQAGERSMTALSVVVALTLWREGSEVVLFMAGLLSVSKESLLSILVGAGLGTAGAVAVGALLYFGLVRLSTGRMFSATGWLLTLLACGMSAQAAGFFSSAGWLPDILSPVWDTSRILSEESLPGRVLHTLVGYIAKPSLMQVIWYAATFAVIAVFLKRSNAPSQA